MLSPSLCLKMSLTRLRATPLGCDTIRPSVVWKMTKSVAVDDRRNISFVLEIALSPSPLMLARFCTLLRLLARHIGGTPPHYDVTIYVWGGTSQNYPQNKSVATRYV